MEDDHRVNFRLATEADHSRLMEIQSKYPERQSFDPYEAVNGPVIVAEEDGKIVGVAIGRRTVEAFMALEPEMSNFKKAKAMLGLAKLGAEVIGSLGYCEMHLFSMDKPTGYIYERLPHAHGDSRQHVWIDVTGDN